MQIKHITLLYYGSHTLSISMKFMISNDYIDHISLKAFIQGINGYLYRAFLQRRLLKSQNKCFPFIFFSVSIDWYNLIDYGYI